MNTTIRLLDLWKAKRNIESDNAAAIELGLGRQAISRWRNENRNAEPVTVKRMAEEIGEEPAAWVFAVEAEKQNADNRRALLSLAKRLGYAAMLCMSIGAGHLPIM